MPNARLSRANLIQSGALVLTLVAACGDDGAGPGDYTGGGTTGAPSTTTTTTATTTTAGSSADSAADTSGGFEPDPDQCVFSCANATECCQKAVVGPGAPPPGITCPGDYPYNWQCVTGLCKLGGCTSDAQCNDLFPGFECMVVDAVLRCVAPCTDDESCEVDRIMPGTVCVDSDLPPARYCRQPL